MSWFCVAQGHVADMCDKAFVCAALAAGQSQLNSKLLCAVLGYQGQSSVWVPVSYVL